jgi:hypothetical protein
MALITAVPPMVFASCVRMREEKNEVCQGKMRKDEESDDKSEVRRNRFWCPFYRLDLQSLSQSFHKPSCDSTVR